MEKIALAPRRARKKNETTGLVVPALAALNAFAWCQVWRSNVGALRDETGRLVRYGLCDGASDILGIVRVVPTQLEWGTGRFFALECKMPGKKPTAAQEAFLELVRARGGFAAWCDSLDGAIAAAQRARDPGQDR